MLAYINLYAVPDSGTGGGSGTHGDVTWKVTSGIY